MLFTKSFTKAQIVIGQHKDFVIKAVIATLKDMKIKVDAVDISLDKSRYYKIDAWSSLTLTRVGFQIWVFITDLSMTETLLDIYNNFPVKPDKKFMKDFFHAFGKYISLTENYSIEVVKEMAANELKSSMLCPSCKRNVTSMTFQSTSKKLCHECFEIEFGKILLSSGNVLYYGGHKAYLAGGVFSDNQPGSLILTNKFLIFQTIDKDSSKRWEIIIPLKDVAVDRWRVDEVETGVIHESGKDHNLVVAYIDQNGIPQEPRFSVSSLGGKTIKEWSALLYEKVVEAKRKNDSQLKGREMEDQNDDPLKILKIRLAKGEISKQEYEELRNTLES